MQPVEAMVRGRNAQCETKPSGPRLPGMLRLRQVTQLDRIAAVEPGVAEGGGPGAPQIARRQLAHAVEHGV